MTAQTIVASLIEDTEDDDFSVKEIGLYNSALGGYLKNVKGVWRWSDGTPEPRVYNVRFDHSYDFHRHNGNVEVSAVSADREPDLRFATAYPKVKLNPYLNYEVYLVPLGVWNSQPPLAGWDKSDDPAILAKAVSLGWKHRPSYS